MDITLSSNMSWWKRIKMHHVQLKACWLEFFPLKNTKKFSSSVRILPFPPWFASFRFWIIIILNNLPTGTTLRRTAHELGHLNPIQNSQVLLQLAYQMSDSGGAGDNQSVHRWLKYRTLLLNFVLGLFFFSPNFFFSGFLKKKKKNEKKPAAVPADSSRISLDVRQWDDATPSIWRPSFRQKGRKIVVISKLLKILDIISKVSRADRAFHACNFLKMNHKKATTVDRTV